MLRNTLNKYVVASIGCIILITSFSCNNVFVGRVVEFRLDENDVHFKYVGKDASLIYCISFEDTILSQEEIFVENQKEYTLPNLKNVLTAPNEWQKNCIQWNGFLQLRH